MAKKKSPDATVLDRLFATVESRRGARADTSYTAGLLAAGTDKIARKLNEEALETVLAAVAGEGKKRLAAESADLLYHLLVLWADGGVEPQAVWKELARREGTSGIAEKAARKKK